MSLKINIDIEQISSMFKEFQLEVQQDLQKGVANLAAITHAKVNELANQELHSTKKKYTDSLGFEEVSEGVWVVSLGEEAMWIEEGISANTDMKPDLLKDATKTSKDGHKYRAIHFEHSKAPSQMTPYAQNLVDRIKFNLKKQNIPFKKIEKNPNGSPRLGKLHTLDFGGEMIGRANTPVLKGVTIYQSLTKTGNVRRDILTFRAVSESPASAGKWMHPGFEAKKLMDKALEFSMNAWEQQILPEILAKYK